MQMAVEIIQESQSCYRATCPAMPGCVAKAPTQNEAVARIKTLIKSYLCSLDISVPASIEAVCKS